MQVNNITNFQIFTVLQNNWNIHIFWNILNIHNSDICDNWEGAGYIEPGREQSEEK